MLAVGLNHRQSSVRTEFLVSVQVNYFSSAILSLGVAIPCTFVTIDIRGWKNFG